MKTRIMVTLVAVLALAGCTSTTSHLPVRTDYSKTTAFSDWKNFRFTSESERSDYQRYPRFERLAQQARLEPVLADALELPPMAVPAREVLWSSKCTTP